jgi:hypothetical protein
MDIIAKLDLASADQKELARILSCKEGDLPKVLISYAGAATEEMVTMILGQRVFTRGSDLLEYRLLLLIKHAFGGKIPDEQEICRLFQMTATASRALIRAVMSKFQYLLKSEIEGTLKSLISEANVEKEGNVVSVSVHNLNLVDELNRELAEADTNLPPVQKKRGSVSTYVLQPSAYLRLCTRFGIQPKKMRATDE